MLNIQSNKSWILTMTSKFFIHSLIMTAFSCETGSSFLLSEKAKSYIGDGFPCNICNKCNIVNHRDLAFLFLATICNILQHFYSFATKEVVLQQILLYVAKFVFDTLLIINNIRQINKCCEDCVLKGVSCVKIYFLSLKSDSSFRMLSSNSSKVGGLPYIIAPNISS